MVNAAAIRVPHNVRSCRIEIIRGISGGHCNLVNMLARQPTPLEIFTSASVKCCLVCITVSSPDCGHARPFVIGQDGNSLEQRPVKAHVLTVCPVYGNIPRAKRAGAPGNMGNSHRRRRHNLRGRGICWNRGNVRLFSPRTPHQQKADNQADHAGNWGLKQPVDAGGNKQPPQNARKTTYPFHAISSVSYFYHKLLTISTFDYK